MTYIDGFVIPVPAIAKDRFVEHARTSDAMFMEYGALRVVECWADDVPDGKVTDFRRAVQAQEGETVVLSWIEWPDKATRDPAFARMMDPTNDDPRLDQNRNPVPFDGKRMIFGGFSPLVDMQDEP